MLVEKLMFNASAEAKDDPMNRIKGEKLLLASHSESNFFNTNSSTAGGTITCGMAFNGVSLTTCEEALFVEEVVPLTASATFPFR